MRRRKPLRSDPEKIRAWERRSRAKAREKKRSRPPRRSQPRPVGRRGRRLRIAGLVDGPLCDLVRGNLCCVPDCPWMGRPHHVDHAGFRLDWMVERTSEGMAIGLEGNVAPLCDAHHRELHDVLGRPVFEWEYGLNLSDVARKWGERFRFEKPDEYRRILEAA